MGAREWERRGKVGGVRKERTNVRVRMGKSGAQRQERGYRTVGGEGGCSKGKRKQLGV
jgi:hypothetical protein